MLTAQCPDCDADVKVDDDAERHDTVDCEECGIELEVVSLVPVIELEVVDDEPFEDDDDEDDY